MRINLCGLVLFIIIHRKIMKMSNDKLNNLLQIGASVDWIMPSWYILQDFWNRPASRFGIQANAGFDRGDIRRVLRKCGVRSWGYVYNVAGDLIMLSVPKAQAAAANYWLQREGVPVLYAPAELTPKQVEQGLRKRLLGW